MNRLIRWGLIVGLAGGGFISTSLLRQTPAIAIPEAEALKRLENIPTFWVTDEKGQPLLAPVPDAKDKSKTIQIAPFFLSHTRAQSEVDALKSKGKNAKIALIPLTNAFEIGKQNEDKKDKVLFPVIPAADQVEVTLTTLKADGQDVKEFNSIPLFIGVAGKEKKPITVVKKETGKPIVPLFLHQQDAKAFVAEFQKTDQKSGPTAKVQVSSLSYMLGNLLKAKPEEAAQIEFVPATESIKYVIQRQKEQGATTPPAKSEESGAAKEEPKSK